MSDNKFDIEKFWDDFLDNDDEDIGLEDTIDKQEKIDLISAESDNDVLDTQLVKKQDELIKSANENKNFIEKQSDDIDNILDSDIKPIDTSSLSDYDDIKPVLAEDAVDRIKKDVSILDADKDERLEKEYMQNLSSLDRKEIDKILNKENKVEKQQQVQKADDDDLSSFRELEKKLQTKPKSENKSTNKFMQKIIGWFKSQKDKELIANSSKNSWFTILGLGIVFLIGLIAIIIILSV